MTPHHCAVANATDTLPSFSTRNHEARTTAFLACLRHAYTGATPVTVIGRTMRSQTGNQPLRSYTAIAAQPTPSTTRQSSAFKQIDDITPDASGDRYFLTRQTKLNRELLP